MVEYVYQILPIPKNARTLYYFALKGQLTAFL